MSKSGLGLTDHSLASGAVDEAVDLIEKQTNALLVLSATGGTLTADGNEQNLYIDNEPLGCFHARVLYVDLDNMGGGDTTDFKVYYRIADGGGWLQHSYASYTGADGGLANGNVLIAISLGPARHGIRVTLQQTAGVNRAYAWEVHLEV